MAGRARGRIIGVRSQHPYAVKTFVIFNPAFINPARDRLLQHLVIEKVTR